MKIVNFLNFNNYRSHVSEISKPIEVSVPRVIGDIIGYADVFETSAGIKKPITATVTREKINYETGSRSVQDKFRLYDDKKNLIGWLLSNNFKVYQENLLPKPENSSFSVDFLEAAPGGYKGIGTKLVQLAIELSMRFGYKGKIDLKAANVSENVQKQFHGDYKYPVGFYYEHCHLKANPEKFPRGKDKVINDEIEQKLAIAHQSGSRLDDIGINRVYMYLPEDDFNTYWLPEIKKKPILLDEQAKCVDLMKTAS